MYKPEVTAEPGKMNEIYQICIIPTGFDTTICFTHATRAFTMSNAQSGQLNRPPRLDCSDSIA